MAHLHPFDYSHEDVALSGLLARPDGAGPHPAVVIVHDALGISPIARRRARDLADLGYVAFLADMYGDAADPAGELEPDRPYRGVQFAALQAEPERLRARAMAAVHALAGRAEVDAARIGAIGFCFGGQCVLELARGSAPLGGVVSFHGVLSTRLPAQPGAVKAKVMVLTGARDPLVPSSDVQALQAELAAAGADWQVTVYGEAFHAFTDPDVEQRSGALPGARYDPLVAELAWAQATAFLRAMVG